MIFSRFIDYITGRGEQAVAAIGWQELGNWAVGLAVDNRQQIVYYNGSGTNTLVSLSTSLPGILLKTMAVYGRLQTPQGNGRTSVTRLFAQTRVQANPVWAMIWSSRNTVFP